MSEQTPASTSPDEAERDFSDELEEWLEADGSKTVGDLIDTFDERSFAVGIMLMLFVPALPVPTGGISHILEAGAPFMAAQMGLGRHTVWLPPWIRRRGPGGSMTGQAIPLLVPRGG